MLISLVEYTYVRFPWPDLESSARGWTKAFVSSQSISEKKRKQFLSRWHLDFKNRNLFSLLQGYHPKKEME